MNGGKGIFLRALGAVLFLGMLADTAGGITRHRGLEKLLGRQEFSASEGAQIARSFEAAGRAGLDDKQILSLVATCLEGGFEARQLSRVLSLLAQVGLADLPPESFISKVREGVAKGVPADAVMGIAERRALMLKRADNLLKAIVLEGYDLGNSGEMLPHVAAALESGRKGQEIRKIITSLLEKGERISRIKRKLLP